MKFILLLVLSSTALIGSLKEDIVLLDLETKSPLLELISPKNQSPLMEAIISENPNLILETLKNIDESSVNHQDNEKNTALHYALMHNIPIEIRLINKGASIGLLNNKKESALHLAATSLQKFGPILCSLNQMPNLNINSQDQEGNTPLHIAAKYEKTPIVEELLKRDAHLTIQNIYGLTPLHIAIIQSNFIIINNFLDHQNNKNIFDIQDNRGYTPLHLAILFFSFKDKNTIRSETAILQKLIKYSNLDLKTIDHKKAYDFAIAFRKWAAVYSFKRHVKK